jgi:hypothetical protein
MTTDLTSQGDLITELHLESLFNSGATHAEPEVHFPKRDAVRLRHRAIVADWRTYLPEECVAAMIKDGWHWST